MSSVVSGPPSVAPPGRRRGRPRSAGADEAILAAANRLLAEQGYARLSLEAVAETAGVSKPALYRRWSSKADLATAALEHRIEHEPAPSPESATEDALRALLRRLRERLLAPNTMALVGTLLAEETQTPELIALFRERVWERRARLMREVLARAKERGELREDADVEAALDLLIGSLYSRYIRGAAIPRSWTDRVVATVLRGITTGRSTRAPRRRSR